MTDTTSSKPGKTDDPGQGDGAAIAADLLEMAQNVEIADDVEITSTRDLPKLLAFAVKLIGVVFAGYYLLVPFIGIVSPQHHRGYFFGTAVLLIFVLYPYRKKKKTGRVSLGIDLGLGLAGLAACMYFVSEFGAMAQRSGAPTTIDTIMGGILILLSLEVTRRTTGWALAVIGAAAIVYVFFGESLPWIFRHRGYSLNRVVAMGFQSFNGIFGIVASVFANYVLMFVVFGAFIRRTRAVKFYIELPFALTAHRRGGPAKVAVVVSAVMGSITGAAAANVMTTGTFTIPLMKRLGYRPEFAGGVEAAASTGGGILPPVMGAAAFLVAEFTGTSYATIMAYSLVPALLYFAGVYFMVDMEAVKEQLTAIPKEELPNAWEILKKDWYWVLPIAVVFWTILIGISPARAGMYGTAAVIVLGMIDRGPDRMGLKDIYEALSEGTRNVLPIAGIIGTVGMLIGIINLTGLGLRMSDLIIMAAGGSLLLALIYLTLVSWVLGMGTTVTSSYVIVAVSTAPALTEFGVSLLAAHLIILWVSQDANVTPPICLAAFAAASLADSKPMRTGWESWKLARVLYIAPILMAYTPIIGGSWTEVVVIGLFATLGTYFFSIGTVGYWRRRVPWIGRIGAFIVATMLIWPELITSLAGLAIGAVAIGFHARRAAADKRETAMVAA